MKRWNTIIKGSDPRPTRWWSKALSKEYKDGFDKIDWSSKRKPKKKGGKK